ncbi:MAG: glutaredoxin family protein [Neisseriaceae bacterium]|nr:glutaredoxin family protein [Neisseriaceae bacterium]
MKLTLLFRTYCSLCTTMQKEILDYQSRFHFELNIIDIDDFPDLEEKYNEKVPVLLNEQGQEICHWHLNHQAFKNQLTAK